MRSLGLAAALLVATAPVVRAAERLDHRGQWGLAIAPGFALISTGSRSLGQLLIHGPTLSLSGTFAVGDSGEWVAVVLGGPVGLPSPLVALGVGYRVYFGDDAFKTFAEPILLVHASPELRAGAQLSLGAQVDFAPRAGAFVEAGFSALVGSGFAGGTTFSAGVQVRFY